MLKVARSFRRRITLTRHTSKEEMYLGAFYLTKKERGESDIIYLLKKFNIAKVTQSILLNKDIKTRK